MTAVLLCLALAGQQPVVAASVDRTAVARGDSVVLTVRVTAVGGDPVRISDPPLMGLELLSSRESSDVRVVGNVPSRLTVRILRLRAVRAGRATIGPVQVSQGGATAASPAIAITVAAAPAPAHVLDSGVRALLERLPPPVAAGQVMVQVVPSRGTVRLGDQVDLVTIAWFPRDVRSRLRTIPSFDGPDVQRAWSYQQAAPAGVALSRRSGETWYDLFVQFATIFPLEAGSLVVGRASVSYSLPLTYSFLSRELRHVAQSDSLVLAVQPLPAQSRPPAFTGASAGGLMMDVSPPLLDLTVGEAGTLTVTLAGRGNVTLWPEPQIRWPAGVRAYPGTVDLQVGREQGFIRGTKTFAYLVVADSAGTHRAPAIIYPYYDLDGGRYVELKSPPLEIAAKPSVGRRTLRGPPPPLWRSATASPVAGVGHWPGFVWLLIALGPPAVLYAVRRPRRRPVPARLQETSAPDRLETLERRFRFALERMVPDANERDGDELAAALRAAGIEAPLASHVTRVRDRLRHAVYGRHGTIDPEELGAEVQEVLRVLLGERTGDARRGAFATAIALLLCARVATFLQAQSGVSAEQLYDAGAFPAAADSFAARAAHAPDVAAHWYNLGNAWYHLGVDQRARVAWLHAARLAPRHTLVAQALALLGPSDAQSERAWWVSPITPPETFLLGMVLWIVGWVMMAWRRARRFGVIALVLAVGAAAYGGFVRARYAVPLAVTLEDQISLRDAPYGSAETLRRFPDGTALRIERERAGWLLVSYDGTTGWVARDEVEPF